MTESEESAPTGLSRRGLLGLVGAGAAGLALGGGAVAAVGLTQPNGVGVSTVYPFFGEHQAGITTPAQDRLHFAAYDMAAGATRQDLIELLHDWTYAAARLTAGLEVTEGGAVDGSPLAPPDD